jgi:hypothetical protein
MSVNIFKKISIVLLIAVFILPATTYARTFLRNLRMGDYGDDVLFVQKVLNLDPQTQVSVTGLGSPGNETSYFGPATRNAIIKFQNLYSGDVLKPAGLSVATGVIGLFTQKKINALSILLEKQQNKPINPLFPQNPSKSGQNTGSTSNGTPFIVSVSPKVIGFGDNLTIKGKNFDTNDNTVLISIENDDKFTRIPSFDSTTLNIPANLTFVSGMNSGMANLTGENRARAIEHLISKGQFVAGPGDGSAYMNATVEVKNKNGTSNYSNVLVRVINK